MRVSDFMEELSRKGYKMTPQRKLILEIIENQDHLSAEEIFDEVKQHQPNVSFGTVYRNLGILCQLGLVEQLDFKDGRYRFEMSEKHHHHLICLDCGTAIEVPACPFNTAVKTAAAANGFQIKNHSFEVFGYCRACKSGQKRGNA